MWLRGRCYSKHLKRLLSRNERSALVCSTFGVTGQDASQPSGLELLIGGGCLERSTLRVLVVDDYEPWRRFASRTIQTIPELHVSEAADGLEAVQKAQELQPDLILLDIGLPAINGIEVARRILQFAPTTKILFVSEQRSSDIVKEALRTGAGGYVVKSTAATELLPAVEAVPQDKQFVSASLTGSAFGDPENEDTVHHRHRHNSNVEAVYQHEVGFYSDDRRLLEDVTQFIGAALKAGNAAIVVATESHQNGLLAQLQAQDADMSRAIEQGRYLALDAADALSTFMVDNILDPVRFMEAFGNLIETATKAAKSGHPRVAFYGEGTHLLWAQGNVHAAIQDEQLCNELTRIYEVDFLCGYFVGSVQGEMDPHIFQRICAAHSAVRAR
jgi:DNA-binding NarL/FixJ family response regulator